MAVSYSHKHRLIFALDLHYQIYVYNIKGEVQKTFLLDNLDRILLFQVYGDEFVVGTHEGIVRTYKMLPEVHLSSILFCHWKEDKGVSSYSFSGNDKISFVSDDIICQYDTKSHQIT